MSPGLHPFVACRSCLVFVLEEIWCVLSFQWYMQPHTKIWEKEETLTSRILWYCDALHFRVDLTKERRGPNVWIALIFFPSSVVCWCIAQQAICHTPSGSVRPPKKSTWLRLRPSLVRPSFLWPFSGLFGAGAAGQLLWSITKNELGSGWDGEDKKRRLGTDR